MTLKQLRYVEALARHGHFGRAAEVCSVTQPALSMQVKELETALGTALFERGARSVRLTGFGETFVARARAILRAAEDLEDLARSAANQLSGRLRLGVIPTIAPYLLPAIISDLARVSPDLDLHVRETTTQKLVQELADGRLDMALVALPVSEPSLREVPLFSEHFVLVRHRDEADRPVPSRDMLREMRLLLLEEGHCFRDQALSFCNMGPSRPRELLDGSSLATLVQMVGAGIGVSLIPEMAVPVETRSAPVAVSRFPPPQPSRVIGMVWRRTSPLTRQLLQITDVVRATAATRGLTSAPTVPR